MKNSIKLTALLLLASASVFAASPLKTNSPAKSEITFTSMPFNKGLEVKVEAGTPSKAVVIVYNQDKDVIFKDALPANTSMEKGYILNQLENGDYTIEVTSNHQTVTKSVHIYDEDGAKAFIVTQ